MCSSPVLSKSGFIDSDDGTITLYLRKQRFLQEKHMKNGRLYHNNNDEAKSSPRRHVDLAKNNRK